MKVQLNALMAGPDGIHEKGSIIDVDEVTADYLVKSGQAWLLDSPVQEERAVSTEAEQAETTTRKRRR